MGVVRCVCVCARTSLHVCFGGFLGFFLLLAMSLIEDEEQKASDP